MVAIVVVVSMMLQLEVLFFEDQFAAWMDPSPLTPPGTRVVRYFSFFTIQSNIVVAVSSVMLAINPERDGVFWRIFRLDAVLGIVMTGFAYHTTIAHRVQFEGFALVATVGLHSVAPLLTLAGWLVFGPRRRTSWRTLGLALIWPAAWVVYTFVHGALTAWYPYPFLDAGRIGYPEAIRNVVVLLAIGVGIAVTLTLLDRRLPALLGRTRR